MFRKAQMKLFGIITAVLLAIFIALLSSVNIIMKMVMERQSRSVLKQVAAGVEYNPDTGTFDYLRPDNFGREPRMDNREYVPPEKPAEERTTVPQTTAEDTTADDTTAQQDTTQQDTTGTPSTVSPDTTAPHGTEPEEPGPPEQPDPTDPPAVQPPSEKPTEATKPPAVTTQTPANTAPPVTTVTTAAAIPQPPGWEDPSVRPPQRPDRPGWGRWPKDDDDDLQDHDDGQYTWWGFTCDEDDGDEPNNGWRPPQTPGYRPAPDEEVPEEPVIEEESLTTTTEGGIMSLANIVTTTSTTARQSNTTQPKQKYNSYSREGAEPVPKTLSSIDFFIVMADSSGKFLAKANNEELTADTAQKYITKILDSGSETGTLNNFQFYRQEKDNGTLLVFTDKTAEINMLNKLIRTTIIIGVCSFILLTAAAYFLSRQIIKPLKTAFEKQKQFVSDASHELKTPVTVISANADVLAGEIGENKWLAYIKSQTERMNVLVNDLLNLTRLENNTSSDFIRTDFDLSKAIVNTALPFECQAFESSKNFVVQVEDNIMINGSEKHIKQMAAIFIDNALKYSKEGGTVRVSLETQGDKKVFSVYNTGQGVKEEDKDKIFERFYRSDESRNRATGGYGLGLAIAKSIIDKHKFKVHVENDEGHSICFVVTM